MKRKIGYMVSAAASLCGAAAFAAPSHLGGGDATSAPMVQDVDGGQRSMPTTGMSSTADVAIAPCVPGTWTIVDTPDQPAVRHQTAHFAMRWNGADVSDVQAREAGDQLELTWRRFIDEIGFQPPSCASATKRKVNISIVPGYGLTGGADGNGNPGIWIGPGGLADHFGLAHEFTHALQAGTGGFQNTAYGGWLWEDHANFMASQMEEYKNFTHCTIFLKQYPHLMYGSDRTRYCTWQFLEYIKNRYGYAAVNDIWSRAPKAGSPAQATADPLAILMANRGWTVAQLNDVFGDWAMHNVTWDYVSPDGSDRGAAFRRDYGDYSQTTDASILAGTVLDPINAGLRRYSVPFFWAPQRFGYNIVKLYPDAGKTSVTVTFRGVVQDAANNTAFPGFYNEPDSVPPPNSGWRWGVVAVDGAGKPRYSGLQKSAKGSLTVPLATGDQGLYLVVLAAPSAYQTIKVGQPWYSVYRYPWMVQFTNAQPEGHQPGANPVPGGHRHPNGGGWVGPGAVVAATAYVGPYARVISGTVSGNARILDHAVVLDTAQVLGDAVIGGLTVLRGNTVVKDNARAYTAFLGLGEYEKDIVLSGTAQNIGHVEQRGASLSSGIYYDLVDQSAATDPRRGSGLTVPVTEVTATPNYTWH